MILSIAGQCSPCSQKARTERGVEPGDGSSVINVHEPTGTLDSTQAEVSGEFCDSRNSLLLSHTARLTYRMPAALEDS